MTPEEKMVCQVERLRAENDALRERIDMALHDIDSALSYPPGHEKERQWVVQAMKTLKGEG